MASGVRALSTVGGLPIRVSFGRVTFVARASNSRHAHEDGADSRHASRPRCTSIETRLVENASCFDTAGRHILDTPWSSCLVQFEFRGSPCITPLMHIEHGSSVYCVARGNFWYTTREHKFPLTSELCMHGRRWRSVRILCGPVRYGMICTWYMFYVLCSM